MDMNVSQHYKADSHNYQTETAEGRGTGTWEYVKFPLIWDRTVPQSLQARGCKMTWPVSHEVNRETQGIEPTWLVPQSAVTQHMALLAFTLPAFWLNSQDFLVRFLFVDCNKRDKRSSFTFSLHNYVYIYIL